jgi:hypothetical protein
VRNHLLFTLHPSPCTLHPALRTLHQIYRLEQEAILDLNPAFLKKNVHYPKQKKMEKFNALFRL